MPLTRRRTNTWCSELGHRSADLYRVLLDHSKNEYLSDYFAQKLQTNVQRLKLCLDIVQGLLAQSELMKDNFDDGDFSHNNGSYLEIDIETSH